MSAKYVLAVVLAVGLFVWGCVITTAFAGQEEPEITDTAAVAADTAAPSGGGPYRDAGLYSDGGPAIALEDVTGEKSAAEMFTGTIKDIRSGNYRHGAGMILMLLMTGWNHLRKTNKRLKKKLSGDRAGAISLLVLALLGGLTAALTSTGELGFGMLAESFWTAVEAGGVFLLIRKIISPKEDTEPAVEPA